MTADPDLQLWLVAWFLTAAAIVTRQWRGEPGAGLVFAYVLSFGAIHWLAAILYVLPWYIAPMYGDTMTGLRVSTVALFAFGVGCELGAFRFRRAGVRLPAAGESCTVSTRIVVFYIVVGAVFYSAITPIVARIPTISGLASTGGWLMILGMALGAWNSWQHGHRLRAWCWLAASIVFPAVTVVAQGFLGFGFAAMVVVATFIASFYRPRWQVLVAAMLVGYVGLSVYVTYMRDRREIRTVVWGGEALSNRLDQLAMTIANMEWFDPQNAEHLWRIDERLNQNALVGRAVDNIDLGSVPAAYGGTLTDAVLALIPRAIWPDKPVVAGSGDLVSIYTGLRFDSETSVGIGHVMEWYVNFGMAGIIGGFVLFGAVLAYVDRTAAAWLRRGQAARFAMWFMPGTSLLVVGGSFVELTATAAASFVIVVLMRRFTERWETPEPLGTEAVVSLS